MVDSTFYKIYRLLNTSSVKKKKKQKKKKKKDLTRYKHDIDYDEEPVDVIPITESHKVSYLRKLALQDKLTRSKDWFTLENKLLDKYYNTGEFLKQSDIARILTLDLKPVQNYLVDDIVHDTLVHQEAELFRERFIKNLEELERRVALDRKQYLQAIKENPRMSRYDLLKRHYEEALDGLGTKHNVKRLESLSRSLNGYKMNLNKYYDILKNLPQSIDNDNDVYKTWYMTPNERTRHSGMDNVTVKGLDTFFKVVHDETGVFDYLQYPHDVENEHNNCANTCNCLCYYDVDVKK